MIKRSIEQVVFNSSFGRQMRFLAGPRQSGKTTLAKMHLKKKGCSNLYYNWDLPETRKKYKESSLFFMQDIYKYKGRNKPWVCFDEIHKIPKWKNALKGIFDESSERAYFIITGSARLERFRRAGDSLAGRYFPFHLFPVTLSELTKKQIKWIDDPLVFIENLLSEKNTSKKDFDLIYKFSGFPEPLTKGSVSFHTIWKRNYKELIIKEDLRELTNIKNIYNIEQVWDILPSKVGNPLSINSIKEDIEVNYSTALGYINTFELLYLIFHISPYIKNINRAIKKERKYYLFDWTIVPEESARFENYCALELKSMIQKWHDQGIGQFSLQYIRNREGKETDFLIVKDKKPWMLFECKISDSSIKSHHYLHAYKLGNIPIVQLIKKQNIVKVLKHKSFAISANQFFG